MCRHRCRLLHCDIWESGPHSQLIPSLSKTETLWSQKTWGAWKHAFLEMRHYHFCSLSGLVLQLINQCPKHWIIQPTVSNRNVWPFQDVSRSLAAPNAACTESCLLLSACGCKAPLGENWEYLAQWQPWPVRSTERTQQAWIQATSKRPSHPWASGDLETDCKPRGNIGQSLSVGYLAPKSLGSTHGSTTC